MCVEVVWAEHGGHGYLLFSGVYGKICRGSWESCTASFCVGYGVELMRVTLRVGCAWLEECRGCS